MAPKKDRSKPIEFAISGEIKEIDPVNPSHYTRLGRMSPYHVTRAWGLGFNLGNAIKYIGRAGNKIGEDEVEALKKSIWYIRARIHELDPNEPDPAEEALSGKES